jgi:hypothetical protein
LKSIFPALGAVAVAVAALSGCAHFTGFDSAPDGKDHGDFHYLLDENKAWVENKVADLPALPQRGGALPFDVSANSPLSFAVDADSVSVGSDGVVRYTVLIDSPAGAHNVYYEGIRCDTYEWRRYAAANEDGNGWDRGVSDEWRRIAKSDLNAYHAALYTDYMCANRLPTGTAKDIVARIRYHRIAGARYQ